MSVHTTPRATRLSPRFGDINKNFLSGRGTVGKPGPERGCSVGAVPTPRFRKLSVVHPRGGPPNNSESLHFETPPVPGGPRGRGRCQSLEPGSRSRPSPRPQAEVGCAALGAGWTTRRRRTAMWMRPAALRHRGSPRYPQPDPFSPPWTTSWLQSATRFPGPGDTHPAIRGPSRG